MKGVRVLLTVWWLMLVDAIRREPHKRAQRRGWKRA
jgi:hypothetical protein